MTSATRAPGSLTVGPLRPAILQLAAPGAPRPPPPRRCPPPAGAMGACPFCSTRTVSIGVGRLTGPAALAAGPTAGFYVWVVLSLETAERAAGPISRPTQIESIR